MRNLWIGSVAAFALACSAGLAAQATTASPGTSGTQTARDTITVTGCLQAADSMGGATTGTTGSTAPGTSSTTSRGSDRFMLTNARMGAGAASSTTGTSGSAATTAGTTTGSPATTTGSPATTAGAAAGSTAGSTAGASAGAARTGSSYVLDGTASELRGHINHQVEIKGRLDSSSAPAGGTSTSTAGANDTRSSASQTLRVESVRMISATCSTQ